MTTDNETERALRKLNERITNYLANGGLFNPESMEHVKVRELLRDCPKLLPLFNAGIVGAYAAAAKHFPIAYGEDGVDGWDCSCGAKFEHGLNWRDHILALTPADARQAQTGERMDCGHLKGDWFEPSETAKELGEMRGWDERFTKAHCRTCAAIASAEARARLEEAREIKQELDDYAPDVFAMRLDKRVFDLQNAVDDQGDGKSILRKSSRTDKTVLLSIGDGPEHIEIYTSEDEAVVNWAGDVPALFLTATCGMNSQVKLGPFSLSKNLIEQLGKITPGEAIVAAEEALATEFGKLLASGEWGQVHQLVSQLVVIKHGALDRAVKKEVTSLRLLLGEAAAALGHKYDCKLLLLGGTKCSCGAAEIQAEVLRKIYDVLRGPEARMPETAPESSSVKLKDYYCISCGTSYPVGTNHRCRTY